MFDEGLAYCPNSSDLGPLSCVSITRFGGEETSFDPAFQLYLQTKLSNPHYKPEVAAQCTIINFIATERGLEDQLLSKVILPRTS